MITPPRRAPALLFLLATMLGSEAALGQGAAQTPHDGVLNACLARGEAGDVCICASLMLRVRIGDQPYARFGEISDRIAEITAGAEAETGEMEALTAEGYRYFVPHGQAIALCRARLAGG